MQPASGMPMKRSEIPATTPYSPLVAAPAIVSDGTLPSQFFDLLRQLLRLTLQRCHFLLQALDMPPHRLVEKRRGLRRQPVQLVIGALLERIARLDHAHDLQLNALPQPAQLRELPLLAEVERRPALPQDEAVRVFRDAAQRGQTP